MKSAYFPMINSLNSDNSSVTQSSPNSQKSISDQVQAIFSIDPSNSLQSSSADVLQTKSYLGGTGLLE